MSGKDHGWTHVAGGTDPIPGAAGAGEWIKLYYTGTGITITPGDSSIVLFEDVDNNYTDTFGTVDIGTYLVATILRTGVYALRYRIMVDDEPGGHFTTDINGIDWNTTLYYERTHYGPALTGRGVHDSYVFRSGPDYGDEPPRFWITARNPAANGSNLVIDADLGRHGTYMEIVRLGDATPDTAY